MTSGGPPPWAPATKMSSDRTSVGSASVAQPRSGGATATSRFASVSTTTDVTSPVGAPKTTTRPGTRRRSAIVFRISSAVAPANRADQSSLFRTSPTAKSPSRLQAHALWT